MILSNNAIFEALDDGRLRIDPEPSPRLGVGGRPSPYATCAVDLRLGRVLQVPKPDLAIQIDVSRGASIPDTLATISSSVEMDDAHPYTLESNVLVLGQTLERITLPLASELAAPANMRPSLAARVEGKSSRARFGLLVHFTAPTIHAGWSGPITLEIMNLGPAPILLRAGLPICQLILEEVRGEPSSNPSSFQGQTNPAGQS